MMTVLNTVEIMDINPWVHYLIGAGLVVGVIGIIMMSRSPLYATLPMWVTISGIAFMLVALIGIAVFPKVPTGKFQIEATFTDDFPFTSVMKEYEVIEQRGDIFLLEPKERTVE